MTIRLWLVSVSAETTDGEQGAKCESRAQQLTPVQQGSTSSRWRQLRPPGVHQSVYFRSNAHFSIVKQMLSHSAIWFGIPSVLCNINGVWVLYFVIT